MGGRTYSRAGSRRLTSAFLAVVLAAAGLLGAHVAAPQPAVAFPTGPGYWLVGEDGGVFTFGDAQFVGSAGNVELAAPIVGMAAYPFYEGYWLAAADGGVFAYGSARYFGSMGGRELEAPVLNIAATPSGLGYWLVAADGGVFAFGDAGFHGSLGSVELAAPVVDIAPTPSGNGYWLVAADGGVFSFGDARFYGSLGSTPLNEPVIGMAATPSGGGYWLVSTDGGVFAFGDAGYYGSAGDVDLAEPVVAIAPTERGDGYRLVATDGGVFTYGNAPYYGSLGGTDLNAAIIGIATRPPMSVKVDAFDNEAAGDTTSTSDWVDVAGDARLRLTNTAPASESDPPAGARVLGVEGLEVSELGELGFTLEAGGPCDVEGEVRFVLVVDPISSDTPDTRTFGCEAGANGLPPTDPTVVSGDPDGGAPPVDEADVVLSLDLIFTDTGTVDVDDILVAGFTVTDASTYKAV